MSSLGLGKWKELSVVYCLCTRGCSILYVFL